MLGSLGRHDPYTQTKSAVGFVHIDVGNRSTHSIQNLSVSLNKFQCLSLVPPLSLGANCFRDTERGVVVHTGAGPNG